MQFGCHWEAAGGALDPTALDPLVRAGTPPLTPVATAFSKLHHLLVEVESLDKLKAECKARLAKAEELRSCSATYREQSTRASAALRSLAPRALAFNNNLETVRQFSQEVQSVLGEGKQSTYRSPWEELMHLWPGHLSSVPSGEPEALSHLLCVPDSLFLAGGGSFMDELEFPVGSCPSFPRTLDLYSGFAGGGENAFMLAQATLEGTSFDEAELEHDLFSHGGALYVHGDPCLHNDMQ